MRVCLCDSASAIEPVCRMRVCLCDSANAIEPGSTGRCIYLTNPCAIQQVCGLRTSQQVVPVPISKWSLCESASGHCANQYAITPVRLRRALLGAMFDKFLCDSASRCESATNN